MNLLCRYRYKRQIQPKEIRKKKGRRSVFVCLPFFFVPVFSVLDFRFFSAYMKSGIPRKVNIFAISNP